MSPVPSSSNPLSHFVVRSRLRAAVSTSLCGALGLTLAGEALAFTRLVDADVGSDDTSCVALPCRSIEWAVQNSVAGDEILLRGDFTEHAIHIPIPLTLRGRSGASVNADGQGRHFSMRTDGEVRIEDLTLIGGDQTGGEGGSILVDGGSLLTLRVSFEDNTADDGGAIRCTGYDPGGPDEATMCTGLTIRQSVFRDNSAQYGGAISSQAPTLIKKSELIGNHATALAGSVFSDGLESFPNLDPEDPDLTIYDTQFDENSSDGSGGALYVRFADAAVRRSSFFANTATLVSGAIGGPSQADHHLHVFNSTFSENEGGSVGAVTAHDLLMANVSFVDNLSSNGSQDFTGTLVEMRNSIVAHPNGGDLINFAPTCAFFGELHGDNNLMEKNCENPNLSPVMSASFWREPLSAGSLGAFDYHGGLSRSYALLPGSNAVNTGTDDCFGLNQPLALDQRAQPRPSLGTCDVGAYELNLLDLDIDVDLDLPGPVVDPRGVPAGSRGVGGF